MKKTNSKCPARKLCKSCGRRRAVSMFWVRSDNGRIRNQCKECLSRGFRVSR